MFELIVRVVLASGAMAAAGILGQPSFEVAWKTSVFFAAYSYLLYMVGQRGLRNPGIAGLAAVVDGGVIAVFLADMGRLADFGFVCALPMVVAYFRDKANAAMMAPLVASFLLIGANLFGGGNGFTPALLVQALGVLVVGVVLSQVRTARENKRERQAAEAALAPTPEPAATTHQPAEPMLSVGEQEYIELRDSFRALTDSARELEKRGRKDRACVQLFESAVRQSSSPFAAVAASIQDLTGAEGVILYAAAHSGETLVVRSSAGSIDQAIAEASLSVPRRATEAEVEAQAKATILATRSEDAKSVFTCIALKVRGKLAGMLALFHSNAIELEASLRRTNETIDFLSELVSDLVSREDDRRRMKEAELLYTVATTTLGATTKANLAGRVVRELGDAVKTDHLSVWSVENGTAELLASEGADLQIVPEVVFPQGKGVEGWLRSGGPILKIDNARNDARIPSQEAVRRRIGSLLLVPLEFGAQPFGFLVATTGKPNGIDTGEAETLRAVSAELSQAIARITDTVHGPEGLATPREFYDIVQRGGEGHLVYLEVPGRDELAEAFGKPALEHAIRRFAVRLRSELPLGAALTRRNEGDYVAFVPSNDEEFVRRWANDVAALASMVGVRTPDGRTRIPLALRAKVAPVNQQLHRISSERVA